MKKHTILFLAADPSETDRRALDREARAIQVELERSGFRDCFELVTRWAVEPLDLLRELRRLRPTVVHFSGRGGQDMIAGTRSGSAAHHDTVEESGHNGDALQHGLFFQGFDGRPQLVSTKGFEAVFGAAGASVKLVVLSACYSEVEARALLAHVDCVVGMAGSIRDDAARSFAIGFYGGLAERESIAAAYKQGCAAISLERLHDSDRPQLEVRAGVDAMQLVLAGDPARSRADKPEHPGMSGQAQYTVSSALKVALAAGGVGALVALLISLGAPPWTWITIVVFCLVAAIVFFAALAHRDPETRLHGFVVQIAVLVAAVLIAKATTGLTIDAAAKLDVEPEMSGAAGLAFDGPWPIDLACLAGGLMLLLVAVRRSARPVMAEEAAASGTGAAARSETSGSAPLPARVTDTPVALAASPRATALAAAVDGPAARFGRSLAVVIGIDTYGEGIAPLRSAVADARAIAEALRRDHGFEVWGLFDDDAGLPQLTELLRERLPAALGPGDRLLLYFAGHGIALDGDAGPAGYLVPARARRDQRAGFLPMHVVHGELARLPVRHALVVLDCCFAGTFRWSSLRDFEPAAAKIYRERYDRYLDSAAWQVLTSASSDQLALDMLANDRGEDAGAHSPFALALLEGLAGAADYTRDNLITADELAMFVRERVAPAAEAVGRRQVPQLFPLDRHDAGQFVLQVPGRPLALAPAPPLDEDASPYRGLRSFSEDDRALFFGRDAAAGRLVEAVAARPLTVVVGPSGSGKSSLVHAGLVPALRAQGWTVLPTQRPGREPLAALDAWTRALDAPAAAAGGAAPPAAAAWLAAAAARAAAAPARPWLVIVDQLEELLTHRTAEADRTAFLEALAAALRAAPNLHLVVTVRSDAEPQLHETALAPWWAAARFAVPAMTRDELRQIIERPAAAAVLHFEPSRLVDRLIDDVALVPAPLPLLSFALSELYRRCWTRWRGGARDRGLREADYDEMGSVARALTQRATAVHDELVAEDPAYAVTIRNLFTRMVAIVGGEVARRRVPRDELAYGDPAEDRRVADALQRFHDARLISLAAEPAGEREASAYAEPTHDELVRGWTKVSQWLDEVDAAAGSRALLAALGDAVRSWKASRRADSYLWTDPRVELLGALGRARPFAFNADEARFVQRSVRLRRARRVRLIGGLVGVIAVLAVAAAVALWQRALAIESTDEAQRQRDDARRLLAQSYQESGRQLVLGGHPQEAIPYLLAARDSGEEGAPLRMLFAIAARALPLTPALEHQDVVRSAAFSPDGRRVLTASNDQTARIWDAATGKLLVGPLRHPGSVRSAAWSRDGKRVLTADDGHDVRIWDAATGKLLTSIGRGKTEDAAAWSPDGKRVVTTDTHHAAHVWDAATGTLVAGPLQHKMAVVVAAFSPDGTRVVTASRDKTARVWDAATGQPVTEPLQHKDRVLNAAFSPDGTRVLTASDDRTARIWDAATGQPVAGPLAQKGILHSATFSPDGKLVVITSNEIARVWDAATGQPVTETPEQTGTVHSAVFSPDGKRVVTASADRTARIWDVETGEPLAAVFQHQGAITSAAFSPDGTRVVTASDDGTARIWNAALPRLVAMPLFHGDAVKLAAFSPDGARVVTASSDKTARVWDAATGDPLGAPLQHQGKVWSAALSPDGARIVTASDDSTARVWSAATGKPLTAPLQHQGPVQAAAFSRDGARVVTASDDGTARVWSATTGKPLAELRHGARVWTAELSPDGARVVTASDDYTARIWDAATGKPLAAPLQHRDWVFRAAFSPDGTRVLTASADHTAQIWDAATGKALTPPLQHKEKVWTAAFSPDGKRVATASHDGTARVWDAATGRPCSTALDHDGSVYNVAFSPDGTRVVTASNDGKARVWEAATGKLLADSIVHKENVTNDVNSAAFGPDGTRVVTASNDKTARIWTLGLDGGSPAAWAEVARRSPFVLNGGVHVRRASSAPGGAPP